MKPVKPGENGEGVATPSNPGTSINFDAQALHDADEAEYQREENERQQEVCINCYYLLLSRVDVGLTSAL